MTATLELDNRAVGVVDTTGQWCAVATQTSREDAVAERLKEQAIPFFLPKRRYYRQGKLVEKALFANYLFASFVDEWQRHDIRRTRYVIDLLKAPDEERLAAELESLEKVLSVDAFLEPTQPFEEGRWVEVVRGPFRGAKGQIAQRIRQIKGMLVKTDVLSVVVQTLGQAVELEIDTADCEPL